MSNILDQVYSAFSSIGSYVPILRQEVRERVITEIDVRAEMLAHRSIRILAGLSGATAVIMAAYGAHAFTARNSNEDTENLKKIFEVGNNMHLIHSAALLAVPLTKKPVLVSALMGGGIIIFSGSCYYHALTGKTTIRRITPLGGLLLIMSWIAMLI
ncbi:hypothetical protein CHS0354_022352 [Potamilus streckersoni]|uniref:Transmembrane protein 256 homolog n=1 Tax=Potamilus streckersoni TaxID=2493646 RepID=A0AAE0T2L3_9BIVA|nr:hypothetical protein CHS0354_022352 [Potamilus streckersoni]